MKTDRNNPFINWVCYNNITDNNNTLINKFILNTINIIDSSITIHTTLYYFCLTNIQNTSLITVTLVNKLTVTLTKARDIIIKIKKRNTENTCNPVINKIMLKNVYYYLDLNFSLISQALLCNSGFTFMFKQLECIIYYRQHKIRIIKLKNNLYVLRNTHYMNFVVGISVYNLHKQLSHISYNYIKCLLQHNTLVLTQRITDFDEKQCIDCVKVNIEQTVLPKTRSLEISVNYSDIIHIDIIGPVSYEGYKNIQYLLMLVDDTTHWVSLLKLQTKDNVYTQYV